jgi:Zn-dependent protease with chaperone function
MFGPAPCTASAGVGALNRLSARLADRAALAVPLQVVVLPSPIPNAFALPGGRIYVLDGLLRRAESADELAGVLAHEMGHVAHRDGLRNVLRAGGSSALLGLLFGDVTGAGTVVLLGRMLVDTANSRHVETEADAFAARLMHALRRPAKPMGAFLVRLSRSSGPTLIPFLASHPVGADRLAALAAGDTPDNGPPLLTDEEWRSLKSVCKRG